MMTTVTIVPVKNKESGSIYEFVLFTSLLYSSKMRMMPLPDIRTLYFPLEPYQKLEPFIGLYRTSKLGFGNHLYAVEQVQFI